MIRKRKQKAKNPHYVLLVNRHAGNYQKSAIKKFIESIRKKNHYYTIFEPASAMDFLGQALVAAGLKRPSRTLPPADNRRGPVTALIACGGDGTVNLTARAAMKAELPVGILPMGSFNNIARSLYKDNSIEKAVKIIAEGNYNYLDCGQVGNQFFFGSMGMGFIPELAKLLEGKRKPRFSLGWSQIGSKAAAGVRQVKTVIKIDAFRFDINPIILNINLLPHTLGLEVSPVSVADDGEAEIIFDLGDQVGAFSSFTRLINKGKYVYGNEVRIYRGRNISIQPTRDRQLYLDGELVDLEGNMLDVTILEKKLKVFI